MTTQLIFIRSATGGGQDLLNLILAMDGTEDMSSQKKDLYFG